MSVEDLKHRIFRALNLPAYLLTRFTFKELVLVSNSDTEETSRHFPGKESDVLDFVTPRLKTARRLNKQR
jgi:hypothetical protein